MKRLTISQIREIEKLANRHMRYKADYDNPALRLETRIQAGSEMDNIEKKILEIALSKKLDILSE